MKKWGRKGRTLGGNRGNSWGYHPGLRSKRSVGQNTQCGGLGLGEDAGEEGWGGFGARGLEDLEPGGSTLGVGDHLAAGGAGGEMGVKPGLVGGRENFVERVGEEGLAGVAGWGRAGGDGGMSGKCHVSEPSFPCDSPARFLYVATALPVHRGRERCGI